MDKKIRIFQIGFNKCGTRSLYHFFKNNGVKSVHYDAGNIAKSIFKNYKNKKPLISNKYKDTIFFSDMEYVIDQDNPLYVAQVFFKQLAVEYPHSYFILNTRPKKKWLTSRILHGEGSYLKDIVDKSGKSEEEVVSDWSYEWDRHHKDVIDFFKSKPGRLVIFDIENDDISKLIKFFSPLGKLHRRFYVHKGKTQVKG